MHSGITRGLLNLLMQHAGSGSLPQVDPRIQQDLAAWMGQTELALNAMQGTTLAQFVQREKAFAGALVAAIQSTNS